MKLNGKITIMIGPEIVRIELKDEKSRIQFAIIEMGLKEFSEALGRMAFRPCDIEIKDNIENKLGKNKKIRKFSFKLPNSDINQIDLARQIVVSLCPDGYEPDLSFNSQDSFTHKDGETWAHTNIYKWIE